MSTPSRSRVSLWIIPVFAAALALAAPGAAFAASAGAGGSAIGDSPLVRESSLPSGATDPNFCTDYGQSSGGAVAGVLACDGPNIGPITFTGTDGHVKTSDTVGFQCVELATRYLYAAKNWAILYENGSHVVAAYSAVHDVTPIVNGSNGGVLPQVGDVISFSVFSDFRETDTYPGHVAVVSSVTPTRVTILSENFGGIATHTNLAVSGGQIVPGFKTEDSSGDLVSTPYIEWLPTGASGRDGASTVDTALLPGSTSGYALSSHGNISAFGGAPTAHPSATWTFNIARRIVVLPSGTGGYVLDGYGALHPFAIGSSPMPPATSGGPYWSGWDIARGVALLPSGKGGYVLDGWGGVHPFAIGSNPMPAATSGGPYWNGWDIARGIDLMPSGKGGYVLDGYGGVHPFTIGSHPMPPAVTVTGYWNGWDIARDLVLDFTGSSGYTLDGYGGIHPFAAAGTSMPPPITSPDYAKVDTARGMALYQVKSSGTEAGHAVSNIPGGVAGEYVTSAGTVPDPLYAPAPARDVADLPGEPKAGYVLDGEGDISAFGGAPTAHPSTTWTWDIARRIVVLPSGTGGYVLDGWGGLHPFAIGSNPMPPATSGGPYWSGWDIARGVALLPNGKGGYVLDGYGGIHPFAIGSNPVPPATSGSPYWNGSDIARGVSLLPKGEGGYLLDGYGDVYPFAIGSNALPPAVMGNTVWTGWDIARNIVLLPGGKGGEVLDGYGGLHPFAIGSSSMPGTPSLGGYYPGWDVVTSVAVVRKHKPLTLATVDSHGDVHKAS